MPGPRPRKPSSRSLSATARQSRVEKSAKSQSAKSQSAKSRSAKSRSGKSVTAQPKVSPRTSAKEPQAFADAAAGDDTLFLALSLPEPVLGEGMAAYFAKCEEKLGFVPNVLKAYAFDNAKLEAFVAMYNDLMLAPSGLSKLEREMIAVAVSSHNKCYYCLVAHGAAVRQFGNDPVLGELIAMNYRAARLSKRHRAMLDFAVKLTREPWAIDDEDRDALRHVGFSERDIWDIGAVAAFFNMTNRVASASDMRPNTAYHKQAR